MRVRRHTRNTLAVKAKAGMGFNETEDGLIGVASVEGRSNTRVS